MVVVEVVVVVDVVPAVVVVVALALSVGGRLLRGRVIRNICPWTAFGGSSMGRSVNGLTLLLGLLPLSPIKSEKA